VPGAVGLAVQGVAQVGAVALPGLGLVLRSKLYPMILGSVGRNVVFGVNVTLRHPHKIHIGDNVVVDDNCLLDAKGSTNRGITIGSGVFIGRNTILSCKDGDIEVADGANLGFTLDAYRAAGGFPLLPTHEDVGLVTAMREAGVPSLATGAVPVVTSGRRTGRAPDGFARYLDGLGA